MICKYNLIPIFSILPLVTLGQLTKKLNQPAIQEKAILINPLRVEYQYITKKDFHNDITKNIVEPGKKFPGIRFKKAVKLNTNTFECNAIFKLSAFDTVCEVENSKFGSQTNFAASDFKGDLSFNRDTCTDIAKFDNSNFYGTASFIFSKFDKDVFFNNSHFSNYLDLSNLTLGNDCTIHFDEANMPDTIDFSNNRNIEKTVDFTKFSLDEQSPLNPPHKKFKRYFINLEGSQISKIKIDYVHFRLFFYPPTEKIPIEDRNEDREATYQQLLKNFQDHGQITSYKNLDIEYHLFLFDRQRLHWLGWFFYHWWQFGYAKEKIFKNILYLLCLFTLINIIATNTLNKKVYTIKHISSFAELNFRNVRLYKDQLRGLKIRSAMYLVFKSCLKRFWYSLAYTSSVFFSVSLKIENLKYNHWLIIYLMVIYTSGLLSLAYLANYVLNK